MVPFRSCFYSVGVNFFLPGWFQKKVGVNFLFLVLLINFAGERTQWRMQPINLGGASSSSSSFFLLPFSSSFIKIMEGLGSTVREVVGGFELRPPHR